MAATEREFHRQFQDYRNKLDSGMVAILEHLRNKDPVFKGFSLKQEDGKPSLENRMRQVHFWKLHRNKDWRDYVALITLSASKADYLRSGTFEPTVQVEAFIYEQPNWGNMATGTFGPKAAEVEVIPDHEVPAVSAGLGRVARAVFG